MEERERTTAFTTLAAIFLLVAAVAGLASGCGKGRPAAGAGPADPQDQAVPVTATRVAVGTIEKTVSIPGRIAANQEAAITAKAPGRVTQVAVSLGDAVRKGQVLVRLDASDLASQVAQAEAALENARSNYERMQILFSEGAISQQQWDQARLQKTQAEAAVDLARSALANATIVAPFDGYVTSLSIHAGELAAPGVPLLTLADTSRLHLEASLTDTNAARITPGQEVRVEAEALPGLPISGRVEAVSPAADAQRPVFPVKIALTDPPPGLKAGMFARAVVALDRRDGALLVPVDALLGQGGERYVFVVEGGVARRRNIAVGISDGVNVEVKSGLRAGESVVTAGQQYLRDGAPVHVAGGGPGDGR